MDDLIKELKGMGSRATGDEYIVMNSRYVPLPLSLANFHVISDKISETSNRQMMFVDGGNSVIFESAGLALGYIRVGHVLYNKNMRISRNKSEFYILITQKNEEYTVRTFPETSFNNMKFNSEDDSLKVGLERCEPSRILSVIRRFAEIEHATINSSCADVILLDGTLDVRYPNESEFLKKLLATRKVLALSKTCSLTTRNGVSVTRRLYDMKSGTWYYYPIVENKNPNHQAEIYFVKCHEYSNHVFRLEFQKDFNGSTEESLLWLLRNSSDPIFLGYPYGFIDVDQYVRISSEENIMLQTMLSAKMGKDWNEFKKGLNSMNAHSILDKIKF